MNPDGQILVPAEQDELDLTVLEAHRLQEQYPTLEHQHETASLGMWLFLATEVLFFGTLFLGVAVYRHAYPLAFEKASERLNWQIGGGNTLVLLTSSLTMALAVHAAANGRRRPLMLWLALTAALGCTFLALKGLEYYLDYKESLIPGWKFDDAEWVGPDKLRPDQVAHVKLFLVFYWVTTALHGLHVLIGIGVILTIFVLAWRGAFSEESHAPVEVTGLYWHFVDVVWLFLLPTLYLLGTHHLGGG
jgi:cytochrome c oxidase subunit 3